MSDPRYSLEEEARRRAAEVERDAALDIAASEVVQRDDAEARAMEAHIAAAQNYSAARQFAVERDLAKGELNAERSASANNAFGAYLAVGLFALALLIGGGAYLYSQQNIPATPATVVVNNPTPAPPPTNTTTIIREPRTIIKEPASRPAPKAHKEAAASDSSAATRKSTKDDSSSIAPDASSDSQPTDDSSDDATPDRPTDGSPAPSSPVGEGH